MAEGMITAGTQPQWFEEDSLWETSAIATILMQARAGGISMQQAAEFIADMERRGVPRQVIEDIMDTPPTEMEGTSQVGDARAVGQTPIRARRPTMATYGDVRSVLSPGRANIRTDPDPVGWPGEDLSGYNKTKFPVAEVLSPPVLANNFATPPPARPVDPFAFEDTRAKASRTPVRRTPALDRHPEMPIPKRTPLEDKARYMAGPPQPKNTASLLPSSQGRQPATGRVSRRGNPHAR